LRRALYLSVASIVWTLFTSAISVSLGAAKGSLLLVAFGLTGLLDAAGSAALAIHFAHALKHEDFDEKREHIAFLIVTTGLIFVGAVTFAVSIRRVAGGTHAEQLTAGTIVAAASLVVMTVLTLLKRA